MERTLVTELTNDMAYNDPRHHGMFSDQGNLEVDKQIKRGIELGLTVRQVQDAVKATDSRFGEVYDTEVRERIGYMLEEFQKPVDVYYVRVLYSEKPMLTRKLVGKGTSPEVIADEFRAKYPGYADSVRIIEHKQLAGSMMEVD